MNSSSKEIENAGTLLDLLFSHSKCIGLILKLSTIICVACICFPFTASNQRLLLSESPVQQDFQQKQHKSQL